MKSQTVAQLSRPLALNLVLTAEFERARISSQAATLFGSIVDRRAGRPRQIPMRR